MIVSSQILADGSLCPSVTMSAPQNENLLLPSSYHPELDFFLIDVDTGCRLQGHNPSIVTSAVPSPSGHTHLQDSFVALGIPLPSSL